MAVRILALALSAAVAVNAALPTVTIDAGVVIGTTTSLPSATAHVNKFLGIPFAVSPPERFSPPQPVQPWSNPLHAEMTKAACVQQFSYPEATRANTIHVSNNPPPEESEDCMYINVWAPSGTPPDKGWPVMLWFYGGAFQFGSGGLPAYDGTAFASNENIVLVTQNYRTNVFGFPKDAAEIPITQRNLGLLDQRAGLEWVQKNIKVFGGDPEKVTIFGESAGGVSVDAHLSAYSADAKPPFRAGIMQSGQMTVGRRATADVASGPTSWDKLASGLGCNGTAVLACVRAAPALKIKEVIERGGIRFGTTTDNFTLYANPAGRRREGLIPRLPVMIGTNAQEGKINMRGQNDLKAWIEKTFPDDEKKQQDVAAAYQVGKEFDTANNAITQISTDMGAGCSTAKYVDIAHNARYPTWYYYYNASFPNIQPYPDSGVYHSSEIVMVFGTHGKTGASYEKAPSTPQQIALSRFMTNAWANFARNPHGGPGWPEVGTIKEDVAVIGPWGSGGAQMVENRVVTSKCHLFY